MDTMRYVDLHSHTTASDGVHAPSESVKLAAQVGLSALAITDHDTVAGIEEAMEAGKKLGIEIVPGVEVSTVANGQDIHILGYYIDYRDKLFLQRLKQLRDTRDRRNEMMIEKLQQLGLDVTLAEVIEHAGKADPSKDQEKGETIGRPHIAAVLLAKGYVSSVSEAFDKYLGRDGKAYVNPPRITPFQAVDWIREAGGTPVIAHPGLYHDDELVEQIIKYGVDGIEAYHSDHTAEDESRYAAMAARHGLIATAGSDFHGERGGELFHAYIGDRKTGIDILKQLNKRKDTHNDN